jgi:acetylornithine deacetylase
VAVAQLMNQYGHFREAIDEPTVAGLAKELVRTRSVTGHEGSMSSLLASHLETSGLEARVVPFSRERANVYGHLRSTGQGPVTLLAAHVDTVAPRRWAEAWGDDDRADAWLGIEKDGCLWGLGAADDKGGVAAILCALRAIKEAEVPTAGDVVVALVGDEESGEPGMGLSAGMKALCADLASQRLPHPEFAIYAEPTRLDVFTSQPGFFIASVSVLGKASYFAYPWQGDDALRRTNALLDRLYQYEAEIWSRERHQTIGRPVLVVTRVQGGESVAVPERCEVELIRTLLPPTTLESARDELEDILCRLAIDHGGRFELTFTASRDHPIGGTAFEIDSGHPAVQALLACTTIETPSARVGGAPYWSELPLLANMGIPGVYFGPGDISVCHTPFEHVPISDIARAARSLATLLTLPWANAASP